MTQSVEGGLGLLTGWGPGLGPRFSSGKSLPFSSLRTSFRVCLLPPPCGVCVCVCLFAYAWAPLSPEVLGFQEEVSVDPSRRIWKPEKARPAEAVVRCVLQPETALLQPRSLPVPMPQIPLLKKKKKTTPDNPGCQNWAGPERCLAGQRGGVVRGGVYTSSVFVGCLTMCGLMPQLHHRCNGADNLTWLIGVCYPRQCRQSACPVPRAVWSFAVISPWGTVGIWTRPCFIEGCPAPSLPGCRPVGDSLPPS